MSAEQFVLGIETSTPRTSICLLGDAGGVVESSFQLPGGPSAHLVPMIDRMVADLGIERARIVAVGAGVGPGSFTGLRVGLATAKGLAIGLDVPSWGFPSLELLSANASMPGGLVLPLLDARKGQAFAALYAVRGEGRELLWGPLAAAPEELPDLQGEGRVVVLGTGLGAFRERLEARFSGRADFLPETAWYPRSLTVARMTAAAFANAGRPRGFTDRLDPVYGRKSEAELGYEQRIAGLEGRRAEGASDDR
jgi:tRNA threonylcarbamoyladenosine biosynthesis protein TsaB